MDFQQWKAALVSEIETAAQSRAETAQGGTDDPRIETSQKALFDLAEQVRDLPADDPALKALFNEEVELANVLRAPVGEPEGRYREAKEELLLAYGIDHPPFASAEEFLRVLRGTVDETISEYRLRVSGPHSSGGGRKD